MLHTAAKLTLTDFYWSDMIYLIKLNPIINQSAINSSVINIFCPKAKITTFNKLLSYFNLFLSCSGLLSSWPPWQADVHLISKSISCYLTLCAHLLFAAESVALLQPFCAALSRLNPSPLFTLPPFFPVSPTDVFLSLTPSPPFPILLFRNPPLALPAAGPCLLSPVKLVN